MTDLEVAIPRLLGELVGPEPEGNESAPPGESLQVRGLWCFDPG
jgi:hypothetical protein